jgi:DNA phosphorothioation-dependent restriction protein DptH
MAFADTLVRAYGLGPLQKSILVQSVLAAYEARGITSDPLTWDRPTPSFADVYEEYNSRPNTQRSDALSTVMDSLSSFELFGAEQPECTTTMEMFQGVVVIDMSGYPRELQSFAAGIMLEQLYAQMCGSRRLPSGYVSKMLMIDEVDPLLEMGCAGLEGILRRSREHGLSVVLAAQSPIHFCGEDFDWQQVIRSWVVHNAEELYKPELAAMLQLDTFEMGGEKLYQFVKHQRKLQSVIRIGTEEPLQSDDLPFYEIVRDDGQSYLKERHQEVRLLPLEGMPLLDMANLDTVDITEDITALPMAELTDL